jgi:uncharacterized membrane protein
MKVFFDTVNKGLIVVLVGAALWAWPRLPERIPTHFGLDGQADAWSETTLVSWFLVPASGLLLIAILSSPVFLIVFFLTFQSAMAKGKALVAEQESSGPTA